jgi:hypothetical protein
MARTPTPLVIADLSSFARQLARALADSATPPSHLQFLNQIARAAGYRYLQACRPRRPRAACGPAPVDAAPALSDAARARCCSSTPPAACSAGRPSTACSA